MASDDQVGTGGPGAEAIVGGQAAGAVAQGHAAEQSAEEISQGHAHAKGPARHPPGGGAEIVDGQVHLGDHRIADGHGHLGQHQRQQGKGEIRAFGKAQGQDAWQIESRPDVSQPLTGPHQQADENTRAHNHEAGRRPLVVQQQQGEDRADDPDDQTHGNRAQLLDGQVGFRHLVQHLKLGSCRS